MLKKKASFFFVKYSIKRHTTSYVTLHGESANANFTKIEEFKNNLNSFLTIYDKSDIFNIDETSLYIRAVFNKTYVIDKYKDNKNIKPEKTRITLLLGVNFYGQKLRPFMIGKSKNPRVFKNVDVESFGVIYRSNKTTWLTIILFI
ncbi:Tigger transposable element-derived protein 1 [Dictyocoela muelleri]|nr:Tigger transposable element-derived protein 1 [Dictyocoela muelleri]